MPPSGRNALLAAQEVGQVSDPAGSTWGGVELGGVERKLSSAGGCATLGRGNALPALVWLTGTVASLEGTRGCGAQRLRMCFRKAAHTRGEERTSETDLWVNEGTLPTPQDSSPPWSSFPLTLIVDAAVAVLVACQNSLYLFLSHLLS